MAYTTGTISDADASHALTSLIEAALIAEGWEFVEEVVVTTFTYRVMKNPAENNTFGT